MDTWKSNLRSLLTAKGWDLVRHKCYNLANNKCELCGANLRVECHEIWEYSEPTKTQTLTGVIALCPECHMVKHAGRTISEGKYMVVIKQLIKVNKITESAACKYIEEQFVIWRRRGSGWTVDISYLKEYIADIADFKLKYIKSESNIS